MAGVVLGAVGVTKTYSGVTVLDDIHFELAAGEVHALVGENGAGKSTLIKILGGAVRPDRGHVVFEGRRLAAGDPRAARRLGISVVYQEFTLVRDLSIADNMFLGREIASPFLARDEMAARASSVLRDLGVDLDPSTRVRDLSVAHQQLVEIARALAGDAKVLILDEPTASLSGREVERLLTVVKGLAARGLGVVFISHRFEEVFAVAERVTVLRDGRLVASAAASEFDRPTLIRAMVGRDVSEEYPARSVAAGAERLDVRDLAARPRFTNVSFTVRRGEVVGLAGLVGAGRTSTGLALAGALTSTGAMHLDGQRVVFRSPAEALAAGVAYVTEDRKAHGLFPQMSTTANLTLSSLASFAPGGVISTRRERDAARQAAATVDLRGSLDRPAGALSGGNQQKVIVARYLMTRPRLVILDEPTRGVDVGARAEIYGLVNRMAAEGLAIVFISSDLPEVLGMADRVVVMREGQVTGELSRDAATPEAVMALMTHPS